MKFPRDMLVMGVANVFYRWFEWPGLHPSIYSLYDVLGLTVRLGSVV